MNSGNRSFHRTVAASRSRSNVAQTAPYMHDGSLATLEEVVDFYSKGANPNPILDREVRALNLDVQEKADLIAFLKSLSGELRSALRNSPVRKR